MTRYVTRAMPNLLELDARPKSRQQAMERTSNNVMYQVRKIYPNKDWSDDGNVARYDRLYNSCFNMTLNQITCLVMKIRWVWGENIYRNWQVKHLLWTLVYLKRYPTFDQLQCDIGPDKNAREVDTVHNRSCCRNWHGE